MLLLVFSHVMKLFVKRVTVDLVLTTYLLTAKEKLPKTVDYDSSYAVGGALQMTTRKVGFASVKISSKSHELVDVRFEFSPTESYAKIQNFR